ncbi:MAG: tyrosine-type recombinase/integrase [Verrucomicrobiales bacterium]|nr:tyrosine-type recombinase/integrase [Verrucomicrobiales bacterium]MDF1860517.1 tyrosine-type recombinase/integrase [Verrucomicrobiales bacterium]
MDNKSESKTSPKEVVYGKTDVRYWKTKVARRERLIDGESVTDRHYSVQLQHQGRRTRFPLNSGNKASAATKALEVYLDILTLGWDKAIAKHKNARKKAGQDEEDGAFIERPTVGDLIRVAGEFSTVRQSTFNSYAKAIRKIYADSMKIPGAQKFDGRSGGAVRWQKRVDQIYLDQLSAELVIRWRNTFLTEDGDDPLTKRRRINTSNTLIRNARGLMAKRHLPFLQEKMRLPDPRPLENVPLLKPPSMRYHSKIDAHGILTDARKELEKDQPEQYKAFLLALVCGLRRGEIDHLLWESFDFDRKILHIQNTRYHELKTEDSAGEIDLSGEVNGAFKALHKRATGKFVIESDHEPHRADSGTRYYRCNLVFKKLGDWLRAKGGDKKRPIHELRKEAGSLVAAEYGIFEASRFLRHSDIRITSQVYLDKKRRVTPSLLLTPPTKKKKRKKKRKKKKSRV